MPIYAFRCGGCGHEFEELVRRVGGKAPCPQCGDQEVERLMSAPAAPRQSGGSPPPGCEAAGGRGCPAAGNPAFG